MWGDRGRVPELLGLLGPEATGTEADVLGRATWLEARVLGDRGRVPELLGPEAAGAEVDVLGCATWREARGWGDRGRALGVFEPRAMGGTRQETGS